MDQKKEGYLGRFEKGKKGSEEQCNYSMISTMKEMIFKEMSHKTFHTLVLSVVSRIENRQNMQMLAIQGYAVAQQKPEVGTLSDFQPVNKFLTNVYHSSIQWLETTSLYELLNYNTSCSRVMVYIQSKKAWLPPPGT